MTDIARTTGVPPIVGSGGDKIRSVNSMIFRLFHPHFYNYANIYAVICKKQCIVIIHGGNCIELVLRGVEKFYAY